jgi:putative tryptophan/tyrosine transport system substrate-binding protein
MKRREFITLLGGAAAWPLAARAQQAAMPMLGILNGASFNEQFYAPMVAQFRLGLKELGFVEGQNITIEYRAANGHPERLPKLTADLVQRQAAVILAIGGSNTALVAKAATSTIPIVFAVGGDAVANGLVRSLNKPEANVTGMSFNNAQLAPKRLDLLRELVPHAKLFGYLDNVATASDVVRKELVERARSIGREVIGFYASTEQEIESTFDAMVRQGVGAVVLSPDAYLVTRREQLVSLAQLHALPTIYPSSDTERTGLITYEIVLDDMFRQAGVYAGRILKGAKPAELPVQLPTRFRLIINFKTAKALGLEVPLSLSGMADEVIE